MSLIEEGELQDAGICLSGILIYISSEQELLSWANDEFKVVAVVSTGRPLLWKHTNQFMAVPSKYRLS
jgi:hypothetical protein